jgi:4-amino-4-deoxy-L-arabinose transferase-like glycosyltransferase
MRARARAVEWTALAAITLLAAALRVTHIGRVSPDPFYDAAVRSMSLSWHNFFFGAFEPSASVSIDKPPVDLWLQVASVKLFGFSSTTLKLPEVIAGVCSVPLLYCVVRRLWSVPAALAAALAMAVLPIEVITARSDTMDAVMMALIVLALLLVVIAAQTGRIAWLLGGAAVLGLAFNVKLLESLIALPGIALFAFLALPWPRRRRILSLLAASAVYVAVALSWLTATLLVPAHDRPWAVGSTNGSAWNAAFVFNGSDRLGGKSAEPQSSVYEPGHHYPTATQSARDHIPILPPSTTRLLARIGPLSGERLGLELLIGLLLGIPALVCGLRADGGPGELRIRRATAAGLGVWVLVGTVLFSQMTRLHPRYVEAFTPAVAALLGIGLAWATANGSRLRTGALAVALAVTVYYSERLVYGTTGTWWLALAGAFVGLSLAVLRWRRPAAGRAAGALGYAAVLAACVVAVLAVPVKADITAIDDHVSDAGYVGALPRDVQGPLSAYLRANQRGARYEVAAESATQIGSLIVQDARPVRVLTTYSARVFTPVPELQRLIARGAVRYAFLNTFCTKRASSANPACAAPAKWIRAHGTDASAAAGLPQARTLYLLPGAKP